MNSDELQPAAPMAASPAANRQPLSMTLEEILAPHWRRLENAYTIVIAGAVLAMVTAVFVNERMSVEGLAGAVLVGAAALLPGWMWVRRLVGGLPIVPMIAGLDFLWYAVPILAGHSSMERYPGGAVFLAAATHALFLLTMTVVWWRVAGRGPLRPATVRVLPDSAAGTTRLMMLAMGSMMACAAYFYLNSTGAMWFLLYRHLPPGSQNIAVTLFTVVNLLTVAFLSFSMGARVLRPVASVLFLACLVLVLLSLGTSLLISTVVALLAAGMAGYMLGRGRPPWRLALVLLLLFSVLHAGKEDMRRQYWTMRGGTGERITVTAFPGFYTNWLEKGWGRVTGRAFAEDRAPTRRRVEARRDDSVFERMSMIHMVMLAQRESPARRPHMAGETYRIVPLLFVPRVVWPNKPRTHEGQERLGLHYGLLTSETVGRTFIAWGFTAEAYANFGLAGVAGLAALLGLLMGWAGRATQQVPVGSLPFLVGVVLFLGSVNISSMVMSTWATSLFQALVVVWLASLVTMQVRVRADLVDTPSFPEEGIQNPGTGMKTNP